MWWAGPESHHPRQRSTTGLAVNLTGETAGVIGISYFFHETNHHKLERTV